ncbi:MAG: MBL fold metallo-hydrolase [Acidobacteria bacterium]|nr:MAG: MBL fold metallo-hydrolase [Acidobacteriota bacterium]
MITLASGVSYTDVQFIGLPGIIASVVLHGPGGAAIIDPGPTSTLPALGADLAHAGIAMRDVRALLLTHIHLDHAGATGTLVREQPDLRVYVHEKGAPHLVDPTRLLASATRLYGDEMDRLWGDVLPVPAHTLSVLAGGERISAGGRDLDIAYTPGHASHHVSYFSADTGIAFVGDTAGVRLTPGGFNVPPTPPPDIDLEAWAVSLHRIEQWGAGTLFVTHFGPSAPVATHLSEFADRLAIVSRLAAASLARQGSDEDREAWFTDQIRRELRRRMTRYWRKRP